MADACEGLAILAENSVDMIMTSPPYFAQRQYLPDVHPDRAREIGSEATPAAYLDALLDVVEASDRVLAPHGSIVFELGDKFGGNGAHNWDSGQDDDIGVKPTKFRRGGPQKFMGTERTDDWPLEKSLMGLPHLFVSSLSYGRNLLRPERTTPQWLVRNVVTWTRPNPGVGKTGDKFRPATSALIMATKAKDRYFDIDSVRTESNSVPLDCWEIPVQGYQGAHFATMPTDLCVKPILTMTPERVCLTCGKPSRRDLEPVPQDVPLEVWTDCGHDNWRTGVVLDPFAGSGTTLAVAAELGRDSIGIDLDRRNAEVARGRLGKTLKVIPKPRVRVTA